MPAPHEHYPAIRRGHYEVQTFTVGRLGPPSADGSQTIDVVGTIPSLLRVVVAGLDLRPYLEAAPLTATPADLTSAEFVHLAAEYLREGLIDPGNGRPNRSLPPVIAMERGDGLAFVQLVGCLN